MKSKEWLESAVKLQDGIANLVDLRKPFLECLTTYEPILESKSDMMNLLSVTRNARIGNSRTRSKNMTKRAHILRA